MIGQLPDWLTPEQWRFVLSPILGLAAIGVGAVFAPLFPPQAQRYLRPFVFTIALVIGFTMEYTSPVFNFNEALGRVLITGAASSLCFRTVLKKIPWIDEDEAAPVAVPASKLSPTVAAIVLEAAEGPPKEK